MAERATPSDYKSAKVDELKQVSKGYMAPAGDGAIFFLGQHGAAGVRTQLGVVTGNGK